MYLRDHPHSYEGNKGKHSHDAINRLSRQMELHNENQKDILEGKEKIIKIKSNGYS